MRALIVIVLFTCGCDSGSKGNDPPPASPTHATPQPPQATPRPSGGKILTGPPPRSELISIEEPTPETITRELAGWYPEPSLHRAVPTHEYGLTVWTRYYDGVEMDERPRTSKSGMNSVTRFLAELAAPERPRRDKLIDQATAITATKFSGAPTAKLVYMPVLAQKQLAGTKGINASDVITVVESWRLAYRIEADREGAYVDAYTGAVIRTWSRVIKD